MYKRQGVGILDFQDMLVGHPAYDLASLLADARRDVPEALRAAMTDRYLARSGADRDPFLLAAATLSAQRNLKILGLFTRLCRRDGKPRYLGYLPRVSAPMRVPSPAAKIIAARGITPPRSARAPPARAPARAGGRRPRAARAPDARGRARGSPTPCLLYTSDAADEL